MRTLTKYVSSYTLRRMTADSPVSNQELQWPSLAMSQRQSQSLSSAADRAIARSISRRREAVGEAVPDVELLSDPGSRSLRRAASMVGGRSLQRLSSNSRGGSRALSNLRTPSFSRSSMIDVAIGPMQDPVMTSSPFTTEMDKVKRFKMFTSWTVLL